MMKPLNHIRVVDMTEGVAGPSAASILGDMGAAVIKIESPRGDWGRGSEDPLGPYFVANNRNKRDLCLDLQKEGSGEVIRRLLARADVVISNYRKGVMERLGLGYEACQQVKPGIIYCTISAFGQKGAYAAFPASDTGMQGLSGIMDSIGEADGPPLRVGFPLVDIFSASNAVQGILLALLARQRGTPGTRIDVSLLNAALSLQAMPFASFQMSGELPKRYGNQNPVLAPAGAYQTKDGKFMTIAILGDSYWERFCRALGLGELLKDKRYCTNSQRIKNRAALNEILMPVFLGKPGNEWFRIFREADILCYPINNFAEVLEDSALAESICFRKLRLRDKELSLLGCSIEIDGEYLTLDIPPPLKGEHSVEILDELGYGSNEIETMLSRKIVYSAPAG